MEAAPLVIPEEVSVQEEESNGEEEEPEDREPAVASLLDDDEDRDIQAMILGEVEGIEIAQSEDEAGEAGPQGDAAAESGTASVRERGGRFPHRVSRRRKRGRSGQQGGQAAQEPGESAVEAEKPQGLDSRVETHLPEFRKQPYLSDVEAMPGSERRGPDISGMRFPTCRRAIRRHSAGSIVCHSSVGRPVCWL